MPGLSATMRRKALEALSRDTLASITAELRLAVEDRRAQGAQVDAVVRSRRGSSTPASGPRPR
jgi:molecular chaperone DnaK (HSP70)